MKKITMTKREFYDRVGHWVTEMGLHNWDIQVSIEPFTKKEAKGKHTENGYSLAGQAKYNTEYKHASLQFAPFLLKEKKHAIDEGIVHELIHVLISPFVGYASANHKEFEKDAFYDYFNEQMVSELARIIVRCNNKR